MRIRLATSVDAPKWIELFRGTFGDQYPASAVYDVNWVAQQLALPSGHETWVAENEINGKFESAVSFLGTSSESPSGPIINLGRNLHRSESLVNGAACALLESVNETAATRGQAVVTRIQASGNSQQILYENAGYVCVGLQPLKHQIQNRFSTLFYVRPSASRQKGEGSSVVFQALPEVGELAKIAVQRLRLPAPRVVASEVVGYPLQCDCDVLDSTEEAFAQSQMEAQSFNPPMEISGSFNWGHGQMRVPSEQPCHALAADKGGRVTGGVLYRIDELDRCARIVRGFATDSVSMGGLLARAVRAAESSGALYTEVDVLATAARLLKTAEQLGFVPVAYLPGFGWRPDGCVDVVKLVKLNMPYSPQSDDLTEHARAIERLVNASFEDQRMGLATARLLRPLAVFAGLGDGELRKISRLFSQKLYRAGEQIFAKGDTGKEAFIVLRGQIDILLEPDAKPVASLTNGKIFGELAFLDGGPRSTYAVAAQPSILQVVQYAAFLELARHEPALGMIVMRNIALDLASKLRNADLAILRTSSEE